MSSPRAWRPTTSANTCWKWAANWARASCSRAPWLPRNGRRVAPTEAEASCPARLLPVETVDHRLQLRHALGGESGLLLEDVAPLEHVDVPVVAEHLAHFRLGHAEGRPLFFVGRVFQGDQQRAAELRQFRV